MMERARALHSGSWPIARLALAGLMLLTGFFGAAPSATDAAEAACQPAADGVAVGGAPPDGRTEALSQPFRTEAWPVDRAALLTDTQQRVAAALGAAGLPSCYSALVPHVAERVAFLSPFEFVVVGYYGQDPATRNTLLRLYRDDPAQALHKMSAVWPSPRAEMLVSTPAFFDLDANQIFVNTAAVAPEQASNVLVHEFWHALADVRVTTLADGSASRTTGFWTEQRAADGRAWRTVEDSLPEGVPTYLMNEAMAIEMEVSLTGHEHPNMRPDLVKARDTLHELFDSAGRERVLQLYLTSRSEELRSIASRAMLDAGPG